jgi:hypothetical protein
VSTATTAAAVQQAHDKSIISPFGLNSNVARLRGVEQPKSTEPAGSLVRPRSCWQLARNIPGPSFRLPVTLTLHFTSLIPSQPPAGPTYVHPTNVTNAHLFLFVPCCGSNATDSARVRASICTVCAACLRRLQLLDDNHPCVYLYQLPQHLILTYCNQSHTQFVSSDWKNRS